MSVYVQYAPHKLAAGTGWTGTRDELASRVVGTLERYSPGFSMRSNIARC